MNQIWPSWHLGRLRTSCPVTLSLRRSLSKPGSKLATATKCRSCCWVSAFKGAGLGERHENSWNLTWMYLATQAVLTDGAWWCFRSQLKQSSPKENERCCGEDERHMLHVTCLKAAEVVKIQAFLVFSFFTVLHSAETIFMNNWDSNPASGLQASATGHANQETVKYIFAWQRCLFPVKRLAMSTGRFHCDGRVDTLEWGRACWGIRDHLPRATMEAAKTHQRERWFSQSAWVEVSSSAVQTRVKLLA